MERIPILQAEDFSGSVLAADVPVLVAFSADWCAPCGWLEPYLVQLDEMGGTDRLRVVKLNVDDSPDLVERYNVTSLPTVIRFEGGQETDRSLGIEPDRLRDMASTPPVSSEAADLDLRTPGSGE